MSTPSLEGPAGPPGDVLAELDRLRSLQWLPGAQSFVPAVARPLP